MEIFKKEVLELFNYLEQLNVNELRDYWSLTDWNDNDILEFRDKILKIKDLQTLVDSIGKDELLYTNMYESENEDFDIITFIGKTEDYDVLFKKYFAYDNMIRYYSKKYQHAKDLARQYILGEKDYGKEEPLYYIRLVTGTNGDREFVDEPQIQIYEININDELLSNIKGPWYNSNILFLINSNGNYKKCSYQEFMDNADLFIRENIDPEPKFGIDKLNEI